MGDAAVAGVYTLLMATEQKSEAFFVRMGPTEVKMLAQLSEKTGLSRSDVVRQLIRREHGQVFGEQPAKTRKKRDL